MASTDQLELLFDEQQHDAPVGAPPLSAAPKPPVPPRAARPEAEPPDAARPKTAPPQPLFPDFSAAAPAGEPLLTLSPNAASRVPTPCPDPLPPGARWREVSTDQQPIGFVLLRSRRRSIGFVITDDGLRVTAPNWVTLTQVDDAVREKSRWILTKLREWHARKQQLAMAHTRWQAGGELPYLGKRIVIGVGGDSRQARLSGDADAPQDGDTLWLALPSSADQSRIRDSAQAWLQQRAGAWFGARLAHFLQVSGLKIRRWRLSSAATRWGSCTSDGNIMLNWRLIHFAPAIIDYVIAHELAHLREMNHSQDFWREVGQILPDFEDAKNILRRHDPASLPQF
ncbi:M48 family metallopeptidase [Achromobacter insolitus]|uniref:M48 family metallopeptidase n=1 Tax=Achromobacter insolitus TaxID=217204 RepID=UPI0027E11235|nr:SprT family zinc-dependent metalloprotease [Achromobacter insolitus]MDQ6213082.1 M48 family metallopeptidase [Achromobacter insolitus]